uniref:Uncharacterized protein n=1 Tax=Glossina palpalis gambiensis TaxID=67801 RepID=A0A1B0BQP9_9MUSC
MQATKMRTPFAIQEILGLGVGSAAAAAAAAGYPHAAHLQHHHNLPPTLTAPSTPPLPPSALNSNAASLNITETRLNTVTPPSSLTPNNDCNTASISPGTPHEFRGHFQQHFGSQFVEFTPSTSELT